MRKLILSVLIVSLAGCSGKKDTPVLPPEKASLVFPLQNQVCTSGSVISNSQSIIEFKWNPAGNAQSYELHIKHLLKDSAVVKTTSATSLSVPLSRNTPYSWYVISKSSKTAETAKSEGWKFYNSGPASSSYAPYPATINAPAMAESFPQGTQKVNLNWSGNDVDWDISTYDVYFGTEGNLSLLKTDTKETSITDVTVRSGTTYYWKVITKDAKGNSSETVVYQFSVK
ncbi:hypothetical protein [Pedobacter sp. SYSU D00535]|uniref:hypothetical protein n=1 Tax=Pedobacter sp. SYSU D00535 TaxID=2810308 RepID=UPI001A9565D8|nr:hypothetical protein [Pedobacter sp. SYSU D00535]